MNDIIGKKFGFLKVLNHAYYDGKHHYYFVECCNINCYNKQSVIVNRNNILTGRTKSCGCLFKKKKIKTITKKKERHGHTKGLKRTPIYDSWFNMKQRCLNKNHPYYINYGGRGIKVCKRWMKFKNFLEDMRKRPEGYVIHRIDNSKGYYPENCEWKEKSKHIKDHNKLSEEEKQRRKKIREKEREKIRQKRTEKLEYPLFKLYGNIVPFEWLPNSKKYKVLCKCKRAFLVDRRNLIKNKVHSCGFCNKKGYTRFIKVELNKNIKKALDVLKSNALINDCKLRYVVTI